MTNKEHPLTDKQLDQMADESVDRIRSAIETGIEVMDRGFSMDPNPAVRALWSVVASAAIAEVMRARGEALCKGDTTKLGMVHVSAAEGRKLGVAITESERAAGVMKAAIDGAMHEAQRAAMVRPTRVLRVLLRTDGAAHTGSGELAGPVQEAARRQDGETDAGN